MSATICDHCDEPVCVKCDDVTECAGDGREHCRECAKDCAACDAWEAADRARAMAKEGL